MADDKNIVQGIDSLHGVVEPEKLSYILVPPSGRDHEGAEG